MSTTPQDCAACGNPGADVSCGSDGIICRRCNDVRPWHQVKADIFARKASQPQPIPEEMRPGWSPHIGQRVRVKSTAGHYTRMHELKVGAVLEFRAHAGAGDVELKREGVLYYAALTDLEPADALADRLDSVIEAQREVNRPDPYDGWDVDGDESVRNCTDQKPQNIAARARLIAALAAEQTDLAKKFQPRFPAEGRSCRVYRSNGRGQ